MARVKGSAIEAALRRIVRAATAKDEPVTVKQARSQAEKELGLEDGFLLEDEWRSRSRDIVKAAFEESEGEREQEHTAARVLATGNDGGKSEEKGKGKEVNGVHKKVEFAPAPTEVPLANGGGQRGNGQHSSTESESEGGSESGDESAQQEAANTALQTRESVPNQINGAKRKASAQSSSEESGDSESEEERASEPPAKKSKASTSTEVGNSQRSKSSGSATSPEQPQSRTAVPTNGETRQDSQSSLQAIPTQKFTPPPGYTPLNPSHLSGSISLYASDLEGKEIWHIAAPSKIPISSLSELTMSAIDSDDRPIKINGLDYTLVSDPTASTPTVLLPTTSGYRPVEQRITRTLKLQQRITLPNITNQATGSSAAGDIAQAAVSSVRPQPKGLRMRYRPPGFGAGKLGALGSGSDSASEGEQERGGAKFQFPKVLGAHGTDKRKGLEQDVDMLDTDTLATTRKEKKDKTKKKKDKSRDKSAASDQTEPNGIAEHAPLRPQAQSGAEKSPTPDIADVLPANVVDDGNPASAVSEEVREDKAKRKEEKAKRREEKRLKRERKEAKRRAKEEAAALR